MNDPSYVEAARAFAERIASSEGNAEAKIRWAFHKAVCRRPSASEVQILAKLFAESRNRFADDEEAARQLTAVGQTPANPNLPPGELAAWTMVGRAILNLHETITRY